MTERGSKVTRRDVVKKSLGTAAVGLLGAGLLADEAKALEIDPNTMSLIITSGSFDCAYSHFTLATTAAAMGLDVTMFFSSYGLSLLLKEIKPGVLGDEPEVTLFTRKESVRIIKELRELAVEADVRLIASQSDIEIFGIVLEDLIDDIEIGGAATYIEVATQAHINLHF